MAQQDSHQNGFVLHLFKQVDASMYDGNRAFKASSKDEKWTLTTFGDFDRLSFSPISRFADYLNESSSAYQWVGGRDDIMLYPIGSIDGIEELYRFKCKPDESEKQNTNSVAKLITESNGKGVHRDFLFVTMLYVSGKAKAQVERYDSFLSICKERITEILKRYNDKFVGKEVIFELFGTFNSSELAIIWAADQFAEVQYLVERIRGLRFIIPNEKDSIPVFTSSHTIIAYNGERVTGDWTRELRGSAKTYLAVSTTRTVDKQDQKQSAMEYLSNLREEARKAGVKFEIYECAGEYDFIVETKPPQIQLLLQAKHRKYGALHPKNEESLQYFSASTTNLVYAQEDIDSEVRDIDWETLQKIELSAENIVNGVSKYWKEPRPLIGRITSDEKVRDKVAKEFEKYREIVLRDTSQPSNFCTNLNFLYSDFIHAVNNTPDWLWAKDLETQFLTALTVLTALFETVNDESNIDRKYLETSEYLFNALRQQIRHVAEAGKFSFDAASLLSESTSQFDLLFHMYYGAVKDILSCIYDKEHTGSKASQSVLIPLIQFQPTSIVKSELFFEIEGLKERIVNITVPYDGWGEPIISILSLIHELYHYAAPVDRFGRNELFAKLIVIELIVNATELMLQEMYQCNQKGAKGKFAFDPFQESVLRIADAIKKELICQFNEITISDYIPDLSQDPDTPWQSFEDVLDDWYMAVDGYRNEEGNFAHFIATFLPEVCERVGASLGNAGYKIDKEIISLLQGELKVFEGEDNQPCFVHYAREAAVDWGQCIITQMREILPDYAMVNLANMTICEYLLVFAALQEKLHNRYNIRNDKALPLRVGYNLHLLLNTDSNSAEENVKKFALNEQEFVKIYTAYSKRYCQPEQYDPENMRAKAHEWFEVFKEILANYYVQYGQYQKWFNKLSQEQFLPVCSSGYKNRLANSKEEFFNILRREDDESNSLFASNIKTVWKFQQQNFLCELLPSNSTSEMAHSIAAAEPITLDGHSTKVFLQIDDILKQIQSVAVRLEIAHKEKFGASIPQHGIWFRGSQNAEFEIIPSIMVHYMDKKNRMDATKGKNAYGYLWQYQRNLIEHFKSQADGADEIKGISHTVPDYIAAMQHYQKPTCYLDWSEDAFKSLFFALEDYIEDKDPKSHPKADAALYMMDPMLYNRARAKLVEAYLQGSMLQADSSETIEAGMCQTGSLPSSASRMHNWLKGQNRKLVLDQMGYIPNLSLQYNYEKYPMFSLGKAINFERPNGNMYQNQGASALAYHETSCSSASATISMLPDEILNLPIAIYLPRLNPRIRTQNGQFVAFSPFALPVYGEGECDKKEMEPDRYAYLSLRKIQDFFLKQFPQESPFLYELLIKEELKKSIGEQLRKAGSNKYNIYPELEHLKL